MASARFLPLKRGLSQSPDTMGVCGLYLLRAPHVLWESAAKQNNNERRNNHKHATSVPCPKGFSLRSP